MAGLRAFSGKQLFDAVMLEGGRLVAESVMRSGLALQQWAPEAGSFLVSDQKGRVSHPRLRHVVQGEAPKPF